MTNRGSVLPAVLFLSMGCVAVGGLFAQMAAAGMARQRAATAADFSLLSALRVRRDNLETIAARWSGFGADISIGAGGLEVAPERWGDVSTAADALRRASSGFQGRITSSLTVALDANRFPRDFERRLDGTGLRLGVTARSEAVSIGGATAVLPGAWYARGWAPSDAAPVVSDDATLTLKWPFDWLGSGATVAVASSGRLAWDADLTDPAVAATGHGGFARTVAEAADGTVFTPHRFPIFRAARFPEPA